MNRLTPVLLTLILLAPALARADNDRPTPAKLYELATPSLVAVQYAWADELRRRELIGAGIVVGDDLVMFSGGMAPPTIPDSQMKDFKIIVPQRDGRSRRD